MAREVGIHIKVYDAATSTLKSLGNAVESVANGAANKFQEFGRSAKAGVVVWNQGLELAKKGMMAVREGLTATVGKSLETRAVNDSLRKSYEDIGKSVDRALYSVGDVILPILVGIGQALKPVLAAMEKWLQQNRELVGGKIVEFLKEMALTLVSGIATGVLIVTRAWSGLRQLISGVQVLWGEFVSFSLGGLADLVAAGAKAAAALGRDELAGQFAAAALAMRATGEASQRTADQIAADSLKEAAAQAALEEQIGKVVYMISTGIGIAAANAVRNLGKAVNHVTKEDLAAMRKAHLETINAAYQGFLILQQTYRRTMDLRIADTERAAAAQQAIEDEVYSRASSGVMALGEAWAQFLQTRDSNTEVANRQIVERLVDAGNQVAEGIGAAAAGLVMQFKSALSSIGDIETETRQRIAIVQEGVEKRVANGTKERKDRVLRYVESVSEAEIAALERVGQKAQVITDTVEIRTRTAFDALEGLFKSLIDTIIAEATRALVAEGVKALFKLLGIGVGAATGGVGGVVVGALGGVASSAIGAAGATDLPITTGALALTSGGGGGLSVGSSGSALRSSGGAQSGGRAEVRQTIVALTSSRAQLRRLQRDVLEPEAEQLRRLRVKTR